MSLRIPMAVIMLVNAMAPATDVPRADPKAVAPWTAGLGGLQDLGCLPFRP